jgi:hypothetical protein
MRDDDEADEAATKAKAKKAKKMLLFSGQENIPFLHQKFRHSSLIK